MRRLPIILAGSFLLSGIWSGLPTPAALAQQTQAPPRAANSKPSVQTTTATLDRMTAAGKSQQELARYVFETHGCKRCHSVGQNGKLGFTEKGRQVGQGSQGCVSMLTAMNRIARVRENERSPQQRQTAARFEEFGCTLCHGILPDKLGLTEVGSKLTRLHLGCVEIENLVASRRGKKR